MAGASHVHPDPCKGLWDNLNCGSWSCLLFHDFYGASSLCQVLGLLLHVGTCKPYEAGVLGIPIFMEEESGSQKLSSFP